MIVTDIIPVNTKKWKVLTDEQLVFVLYKGELSRYHLRKGEAIPDDLLEKILANLTLRAKKYAMNLLVKSDKTYDELDDKLKKAGYPDEIRQSAMDYVVSFGYIDDEKYARRYIETFRDRMGIKELCRKLQQKGISREILSLMKEEYEDREDEKEVLAALIEKRLRAKPVRTDKDIKNLAAYLMRRGFGGQAMWSTIKKYCENCKEEEEF